MKNTRIREKAMSLINWSELSGQMTHTRDNIRKNRIPEKYKDEIEILISYIESWLNCEQLTTKEVLINELEFSIGDKIKEVSKELLKIGNNPFNNI